jgi:hypothetical protein
MCEARNDACNRFYLIKKYVKINIQWDNATKILALMTWIF